MRDAIDHSTSLEAHHFVTASDAAFGHATTAGVAEIVPINDKTEGHHRRGVRTACGTVSPVACGP